MSVLIIGAAGAVGKRLVGALAKRGRKIIVADRLPRLPDSLVEAATAAVPNIDVRDAAAIRKLFKDHRGIKTVWNLAAPLSVETAMDPSVAEAVTVGGMRNVLEAMAETGVRSICFTDSIGSFGPSAPRKGCTARWRLVRAIGPKKGMHGALADGERHAGPRLRLRPPEARLPRTAQCVCQAGGDQRLAR